MPSEMSRALCLMLVLPLISPACSRIRSEYREESGDLASVEIHAVTEGKDGEEHLRGGLQVTLSRSVFSRDGHEVRLARTTEVEPLVYRGLTPGTYRLRVVDAMDRLAIEELELVAGKHLIVRIQLDRDGGGVGGFFEDVGRFALGVVATVIIVGLCALYRAAELGYPSR